MLLLEHCDRSELAATVDADFRVKCDSDGDLDIDCMLTIIFNQFCDLCIGITMRYKYIVEM